MTILRYAATIQRLKYSGQASKNQFSVYDFDKPATLKQGQSHQTWYEVEEQKQVNNHVQFKRHPLNSV